jgi:prostasin
MFSVSAAHCIKKISKNWKLARVRIGEWKVSTDPDCDEDGVCAPPAFYNNIVETIVHSFYRPQSRDQLYDIALLRLAKRIKFSDFVQSICLPLDPSLMEKDYNGHTFDVAGWGICPSVLW